MVKATELAWLAGLLDGEGALYMGKSVKPYGPIYKPDIRVEMVHEPTIDRVSEILGRMGVAHTKKSLAMRDPRHRARHIVWLKGREAVVSLAEAILPYLVTKKPHAELLVAYCKHRRTADKKRFKIKGQFQKTYTGQEEQIWEQLRVLNRRGTDVGRAARP